MNILSINNMHDAAAVLAVDGRIVAAAEEERFSRVKHTTGFPKLASQFCLQQGGLKLSDIDLLVASWKPWRLGTRAKQVLLSVLKSPQVFGAKASRGAGQMGGEWSELFRLPKVVRDTLGTGCSEITYEDHHLCHAASCFLCSPFDRAAILTIDGAGEADTTVLWKGEGKKITKLGAIRLPFSVGQFYSAITAFLGFKVQSDEYKVMGLASYGKPIYADFLRNNIFQLLPEGRFRLDPYFIDYHLARLGQFRTTTTDVFGPPRQKGGEITEKHADIAASAQQIVEEIFFHIARHLRKVTGYDKLCLAGGVAFNCVANGKLTDSNIFNEIFIQPAAGDAGTAVGAAIYRYHQQNPQAERSFVFDDPFLGPEFNNEQCVEALQSRSLIFEKLEDGRIFQKTARKLADGKLVGWFQGRMEWGPRALGNRSFLADPRREDMKDIINLKIKKREKFRPFAPSVLEEKSPEYFAHSDPSPFMQNAFAVHSDKKDLIPAVTHVDGTARPQTVNKNLNPTYWQLIREFENLTNVPLILNTSFNVQEPIVCTPSDAIDCFLRTGVDYLVLNNLFIDRDKVK